MGKFTIGKLAKAANVGVETIRYYERRGLIVQPPNRNCGYRQYTEATLQRIRFIKNNQALGLTLNEIRGVLDLLDGQELNCTTAAKMINLKMLEIGQKIAALQRLKWLLKKLAKSVGKCDTKGEMEFLSEFLSMEE
ncbi:MAG: MerR family transcriptional regulator [Desulfobacterales bacterium]|nr:MAG: MerR family transcriptional regulator [Desulfobacterales bacterium]